MTYELQYGGTWKPLIRRTGYDHGKPVDYFETTDGKHRFGPNTMEALKESGRVRARRDVEAEISHGTYMESRGTR